LFGNSGRGGYAPGGSAYDYDQQHYQQQHQQHQHYQQHQQQPYARSVGGCAPAVATAPLGSIGDARGARLSVGSGGAAGGLGAPGACGLDGRYANDSYANDGYANDGYGCDGDAGGGGAAADLRSSLTRLLSARVETKEGGAKYSYKLSDFRVLRPKEEEDERAHRDARSAELLRSASLRTSAAAERVAPRACDSEGQAVTADGASSHGCGVGYGNGHAYGRAGEMGLVQPPPGWVPPRRAAG
jgi:hypothetical protein